jgi:excisionase family DNA binding protein
MSGNANGPIALDMALRSLIVEIVREEVQRAMAGAAPAQPRYVTIAEYAGRFSISQSTVRAAIREGVLPARHIGRALRIPETAEIGRRTRTAKVDATERARRRLLGGGSVS